MESSTNKNRIVTIVVSVIVIVVAVFIGYRLGIKKNTIQDSDAKAKQAAVGFVGAITKGDVDATYALGSKSYQAKNTKERVKDIADTLKSDNPQIADEEIFFGKDQTTNQAIYLSSINNLPPNSYNRTTGNFVIRLVVEDGQWKVDSAQVY